ncbi:lymphocyte antigen 6D-like isoform X2 [Neofelis nebulosa]|uniref:lymphocyte antigen 6D-like isoform X4 n=1 Tax=Neofelis nebulosa TaxID=61452 RepID=UPI00272CA692|nr:lymphocyte antigen 6D-like isoform X4 [Neofelis nebulosa]XP_058555267.1 lymphocyte antigen 6D-like isoform X2 [Neofelis nebulosa]
MRTRTLGFHKVPQALKAPLSESPAAPEVPEGPGTTETMILFALLLVTDLPRVETNVTVSGKQAATLKCHVCEIENSFGCTNPSNCPRDFHFCTSVAVRIYPRFFCVSKQCSRYCPEPNIREPEFREGGRASRLRSSGAWLAASLTLSSG